MSLNAFAAVIAAAIVLVGVAVLWFIGYQFGKPSGNGVIGGVLSVLLGPIGWIITRRLPRSPDANIHDRDFPQQPARRPNRFD
jgi:drug/metabolite transporter (DMT)-like permease